MPPAASAMRPSRRASAPVKAPFSWPKSSLSSEALDERGAVERDEGPGAARALRVEAAGDELLAGAGLALDEDRRVASRAALSTSSRRRRTAGASPRMSGRRRPRGRRRARRTSARAEERAVGRAQREGRLARHGGEDREVVGGRSGRPSRASSRTQARARPRPSRAARPAWSGRGCRRGAEAPAPAASRRPATRTASPCSSTRRASVREAGRGRRAAGVVGRDAQGARGPHVDGRAIGRERLDEQVDDPRGEAVDVDGLGGDLGRAQEQAQRESAAGPPPARGIRRRGVDRRLDAPVVVGRPPSGPTIFVGRSARFAPRGSAVARRRWRSRRRRRARRGRLHAVHARAVRRARVLERGCVRLRGAARRGGGRPSRRRAEGPPPRRARARARRRARPPRRSSSPRGGPGVPWAGQYVTNTWDCEAISASVRRGTSRRAGRRARRRGSPRSAQASRTTRTSPPPAQERTRASRSRRDGRRSRASRPLPWRRDARPRRRGPARACRAATPAPAPMAAARIASIPATARSGSSVEWSRTTQRARGAMAMVGGRYPETKSGGPEGPPDDGGPRGQPRESRRGSGELRPSRGPSALRPSA